MILIQVANCADSIKVACDFMSIDNMKITEHIRGELHRQCLATGFGDDVLAFYMTLWYGWEALSIQL